MTGAARGIGAAIGKALAAEGAAVAINYASSKQQAEQVVRAIEDRKGNAIAVKADISNRAEAAELFGRVKQAYGRLDVLVNNAAFFEFRPLDSIDEQHFRKQFDVNVLGLLFATQEAVKLMLSGGSVVNISSVRRSRRSLQGPCIARQKPRLTFSPVRWLKNWDRGRFG